MLDPTDSRVEPFMVGSLVSSGGEGSHELEDDSFDDLLEPSATATLATSGSGGAVALLLEEQASLLSLLALRLSSGASGVSVTDGQRGGLPAFPLNLHHNGRWSESLQINAFGIVTPRRSGPTAAALASLAPTGSAPSSCSTDLFSAPPGASIGSTHLMPGVATYLAPAAPSSSLVSKITPVRDGGVMKPESSTPSVASVVAGVTKLLRYEINVLKEHVKRPVELAATLEIKTNLFAALSVGLLLADETASRFHIASAEAMAWSFTAPPFLCPTSKDTAGSLAAKLWWCDVGARYGSHYDVTAMVSLLNDGVLLPLQLPAPRSWTRGSDSIKHGPPRQSPQAPITAAGVNMRSVLNSSLNTPWFTSDSILISGEDDSEAVGSMSNIEAVSSLASTPRVEAAPSRQPPLADAVARFAGVNINMPTESSSHQVCFDGQPARKRRDTAASLVSLRSMGGPLTSRGWSPTRVPVHSSEPRQKWDDSALGNLVAPIVARVERALQLVFLPMAALEPMVSLGMNEKLVRSLQETAVEATIVSNSPAQISDAELFACFLSSRGVRVVTEVLRLSIRAVIDCALPKNAWSACAPCASCTAQRQQQQAAADPDLGSQQPTADSYAAPKAQKTLPACQCCAACEIVKAEASATAVAIMAIVTSLVSQVSTCLVTCFASMVELRRCPTCLCPGRTLTTSWRATARVFCKSCGRSSWLPLWKRLGEIVVGKQIHSIMPIPGGRSDVSEDVPVGRPRRHSVVASSPEVVRNAVELLPQLAVLNDCGADLMVSAGSAVFVALGDTLDYIAETASVCATEMIVLAFENICRVGPSKVLQQLNTIPSDYDELLPNAIHQDLTNKIGRAIRSATTAPYPTLKVTALASILSALVEAMELSEVTVPMDILARQRSQETILTADDVSTIADSSFSKKSHWCICHSHTRRLRAFSVLLRAYVSLPSHIIAQLHTLRNVLQRFFVLIAPLIVVTSIPCRAAVRLLARDASAVLTRHMASPRPEADALSPSANRVTGQNCAVRDPLALCDWYPSVQEPMTESLVHCCINSNCEGSCRGLDSAAASVRALLVLVLVVLPSIMIELGERAGTATS